ncbi:MAG TPA: FAD/NAD(P)-binding oxidoreductase [Bryobacteraceae bacterium]|nr:FAD/NAD(P)-binding oxidoreductase [Bryobacteraceae bacterium]
MAADRYDVVVVGGGPAGIAAACTAADGERRVAIIDENPAPGGQIWRATENNWTRRLRAAPIILLPSTRIVDAPAPGALLAETRDSSGELEYRKLVLATGGRECFLPFPRWTLPGVFGAGGLQSLVKTGLPVRGKRVVVAGTGPLLLAVAAFLRNQGAVVPVIAEQASAGALCCFLAGLIREPGKLAQAVVMRATLAAVPYRTSSWITAVHGEHNVTGVTLNTGQTWACDYVACGFGLVPNTELAQLLGCDLRGAFVVVDRYQQTSVANVLCAGEPTGIGGVDAALLEGQIAGFAATDRHREADALHRRRDDSFAARLEHAFALRPELKTLAPPDTIVCRCEDVPLAALRAHGSWRAAKLQSRCGMGPCQGRVCGPAVRYLLGWQPESVRPPILPARLSSLAAGEWRVTGRSRLPAGARQPAHARASTHTAPRRSTPS